MTPPPKPPVLVDLEWQGDLRFKGRSAATEMVLDGRSEAGPSPVQAVAYALAGCMAIDVVDILQKGRHPLTGLRASLTGRRASAIPACFVGFDLHFDIAGRVPPEAVDRAVALSREKYCSVWHSLRQDIELVVTSAIQA
jgi:putative redox protein